MKPNDAYKHARQNPRIPEHINAPRVSVFRELWLLGAGVVVSFLVVLLVLWFSLGWLAQFIPVSWESRLIRPVMSATFNASEQQQMLQRRVDGLVPYMGQTDFDIQVNLIDSPEINAFATLGGQIVVTQGLIDALQTESGLDFVLLHEIAHLVQRDPIRAAASQLGVGLLFTLVTGQGELPAPTLWLQSTERMLSLQYSRTQERKADLLALQAMQKRGGDLSQVGELFSRILDQEGPERWPEFLSTHPHMRERLNTIEDWLRDGPEN